MKSHLVLLTRKPLNSQIFPSFLCQSQLTLNTAAHSGHSVPHAWVRATSQQKHTALFSRLLTYMKECTEELICDKKRRF